MIWLFAALVILLVVVLAGRAHSRHLDAQEARWRSPWLNDRMIDENWEHLRARGNNVRHYRRLLQTELTELERRYIERRLNEERSAIESMTSSTVPFQNPRTDSQISAHSLTAEKKLAGVNRRSHHSSSSALRCVEDGHGDGMAYAVHPRR
jgi:hypothetical protein